MKINKTGTSITDSGSGFLSSAGSRIFGSGRIKKFLTTPKFLGYGRLYNPVRPLLAVRPVIKMLSLSSKK